MTDHDDRVSVWRLLDGGTEVARLVVTDTDFPWLYATVEPTPDFERLRPLFEEQLRLADDAFDDPDAFDEVCRSLHERLALIHPDGWAVAEFLLHVEDDTAWWRWSAEPFDRS